MRVVSWNVWCRSGHDWQQRQDGIIDLLEAVDPDVAGLQEVWVADGVSQAEQLAAELGMDHAVATPPPGVTGVAVLSRWPIREVREHRLPATHSDQPVALRATVDHPVGPLHVVASCVERQPASADDQLAQIRVLADLVADPALDGPLPVLLTADLNAAPDAPQLRPLRDGPLIDTWLAGHGDPAAARPARQQPDQRIDYVLARPGTAGAQVDVRRAFLACPPGGARPPADHEAVVTDLVPG
ncbi:MAG TPA: endonuclease/exonuclease/phosphatase family protein [Natronosporangium sp.]